MTRKKVQLQYITDDSARKATFKKRKNGLMKKVRELSTLCGVNACAIVYSPYDSQPEVWPSAMGVQSVLSEFKMLPEIDQSKRMVNQKAFVQEQISKSSDHLNRQRKENRKKEMSYVKSGCLAGRMGLMHLNFVDLKDLERLIDQHLNDIRCGQESLKSVENAQNTEVTSVAAALQDINVNPQIQTNITNQQERFMDFMNNPLAQMGFGGEDLMFNDFNNNDTSLWSNNFFP